MHSYRAVIESLLAAALLAASCAGPAQEAAQDPADRSTKDSEAESEAPPELEQHPAPGADDQLSTDAEGAGPTTTTPQPVVLTESPMKEIYHQILALSVADPRDVGECMNDAGYPQYLEAWSEALDALDADTQDPLARSQMQIAPHNEEQARTFGMIGIRDVWPPQIASGEVVTNERGYPTALESCGRTHSPQFDVGIYDENQHGETLYDEISAFESDYWDLYWDMERDFTDATAQPLADLLNDQLACASDAGYPLLDVDDSLLHLDDPKSQPSWRLILTFSGIEVAPDSPKEEAAYDPGRYEPPVEGIKVVMPIEEPRYEPTASEIDFALAYVQCGRELRILERFEQIQEDARMPILAEYESRILRLQDEIKAVMDRMVR